MQRIYLLLIPVALLGSVPAAAHAPDRAGLGAASGLVLTGLELREGAVPEPSPPPVEPPVRAQPAPAPRSDAAPAGRSENPAVDAAVDAAVRRSLAGAVPRVDAPEVIVAGAPPSRSALQTLDEIARAARLDRAEMAIVTNTPRDQARFLVEQLFDPNVGAARVRELYGTAGALAAASYRRLRDVYQVLDLSAAQKETMVDVVETALLDADATGQVDDPSRERIDVDPGPRADHRRFERAVAENPSIARCVRPNPRGDDRFYRLELPRAGAAAGGAVCGAPWPQAAANDAGSTAPWRDGGTDGPRSAEAARRSTP